MDTLLVGAPGCGARGVGRSLAERHGARFVDLTGDAARRIDTLTSLHAPDQAQTDGVLKTVIAADHIIADPSVRARLYRGRKVLWLDVPADHLVERLRAARRQDTGIRGDVRVFIADHLPAYLPYYRAGTRVDASGSINETIAQIEAHLAEPLDAGTLILRAELRGGLVELGEGILGASLAHVLRRLEAQRCVIVTSARSRSRAHDAAELVRAGTGVAVDIEELPDGEPAKLLDEQEHLFRRLAALQVERRTPLVALGDDALLEAATFAAAVWLRGVPMAAIPVTTLGLIDTAIGGKGGIDLPGIGRNLLGAIHQPTATILDVALIVDEPTEDRRAALAEAVKYGLIGSAGLLSLLESGAGAAPEQPWPVGSELLELVERCALAKRRLVMLDERDTQGVRMALNLGHTLSHALEAATGYRLRHGEAVAYGLRAALDIGITLGVTPAPRAARAVRLLDRLALGIDPLDVPVADVLAYIEADKKRRDGRLRWVLVDIDGVVIRDDVPPPVVQAAVSRAVAGRG